jgi:hypothetical protein
VSGAAGALQAAALARIGAVAGLSGRYDALPAQAVYPYAFVEAGPETDWGHKSGAGSEVRLAVTVRDAGERPGRLLALLDAGRAAIEAGLAAEGWQIVTLAWQRTRSAREGKAPVGADTVWVGAVEFRARMLRSG